VEAKAFLHQEPTRMKIAGINMTYEGLIPRIERSMLSKDTEAMQPHIRAFVERAVTFTDCPQCAGTRLSDAARSSRIGEVNIADACSMQISDLAKWVRGLDKPAVAPLSSALGDALDSFVEIGLGYLSLERPTGTLSGGEAQRVKLAKELSKRATGRTLYILDEPTTGLHFADIAQLLVVLQRLRDEGNTVIVIEHNLDVIKTADWVVDLGPEGGDNGGRIIAVGTPEQIAANKASYTGHYLRATLAAARGLERKRA
jgi:excinuclease UvrABC ATPase subunit